MRSVSRRVARSQHLQPSHPADPHSSQVFKRELNIERLVSFRRAVLLACSLCEAFLAELPARNTYSLLTPLTLTRRRSSSASLISSAWCPFVAPFCSPAPYAKRFSQSCPLATLTAFSPR